MAPSVRCAAYAGLRVGEGVGQEITYLYAAILLHLVLLLAHRVEKVVPNSVPHPTDLLFSSSCRVTELCHSTVEAVSHSGHYPFTATVTARKFAVMLAVFGVLFGGALWGRDFLGGLLLFHSFVDQGKGGWSDSHATQLTEHSIN